MGAGAAAKARYGPPRRSHPRGAGARRARRGAALAASAALCRLRRWGTRPSPCQGCAPAHSRARRGCLALTGAWTGASAQPPAPAPQGRQGGALSAGRGDSPADPWTPQLCCGGCIRGGRPGPVLGPGRGYRLRRCGSAGAAARAHWRVMMLPLPHGAPCVSQGQRGPVAARGADKTRPITQQARGSIRPRPEDAARHTAPQVRRASGCPGDCLPTWGRCPQPPTTTSRCDRQQSMVVLDSNLPLCYNYL